ncbi:hypothetical protein BGP78_07685 [Pseudoalteromonas sp. MSK9-3]|nr:hypothetical protein BGP78_07685 [Pseudoalteromonas sp. MSK9-3]
MLIPSLAALVIDVNNLTNEMMNNIVIFLFLFSALVNMVRMTNVNRAECKDVFFLSLVMFLSYLSSINIHNLSVSIPAGFYRSINLIYFLFDIVTILILCRFVRVTSYAGHFCRFYLVLCLSLNAIFFLILHVDVVIKWGTNEYGPWLLWTIHFYTVNTLDGIMIAVLLLKRDFLGIYQLRRKLVGMKDCC